jgi:hypothetical protein
MELNVMYRRLAFLLWSLLLRSMAPELDEQPALGNHPVGYGAV